MTGGRSGPVIALESVSKHFGPVRAVDGLDLEVGSGEVFGFLGPNGAGKSTTIRLLVDLLRPTAGRIEVFGLDPHRDGSRLRTRIGYLPGDLVMPGRRTGRAYLHHLARLRRGVGLARIAPLAERFQVDLDRPIRTLSTGNRQKLGVIQAVMHDPDLLVLDEPTSGLDPLLQREFHDLVLERRDRGSTVFLSSHRLDEVEAVAGRVAIIRRGRLVDLDTIASLRRQAGQVVELRFAGPVDAGPFERLDGVDDLQIVSTDGATTLACTLRTEPDALLKEAARYRVTGWSAADRELEDLFLDRYRADPPSPRSGTGTGDGASEAAVSPPAGREGGPPAADHQSEEAGARA